MNSSGPPRSSPIGRLFDSAVQSLGQCTGLADKARHEEAAARGMTASLGDIPCLTGCPRSPISAPYSQKFRAVSSGSAPPLGAAPDRRHRWQNARARSGWIPGVKAKFEFELRSSFGKRPWRELRILARCVAGPRSPKSEAEVGWQICPSDRRLATRFSSTEAEGCFYCLPTWQRGGTSSESSSIRDHWSDRSVACSVQCV